MRILNAILCLMMILFIVVQFNDPDGPIWALIYAVPAIWAGLVAINTKTIFGQPAFSALGVCVLAGFIMTAIFWPRTPGFWKQEVWWETETAREGMGIMIATLVLVVAMFAVWRARNSAA